MDNRSRGVALDCEILERLGGCKPRIRASEFYPPVAYLFGAGRRDITLFVERVPWWGVFLPRKRVWVIWNHEIAETYLFLWAASRILCKTTVAERIARRLQRWRFGQPSLVGFTSSSAAEIECPPPAAAHPLEAILHLGGQSTYKQTEQVLQAWVDHPEFPRLVLTCFGKSLRLLPKPLLARARAASNIELWDRPAPRERVQAWLEEIPVHLCPSSAEGFGHSLNESRLYGAVIISTAAEPMSHYANLTVAGRQQGLFYRVEADAIARAVQAAVAMTASQREEAGRQNQRAFLDDHRSFVKRFQELRGV